MKKVLLILAVAGVMVSCNSKKKGGDDKKPGDDKTNTNNGDKGNTSSGDVPTFSDPDVQAYVNAYEEYISAYEKAVEGKDMSKMMDLSKTGQDLATKGSTAAQKLMNNPEEAKKLTDYMTARSQHLIELSKKLTGQ